MQTEALARVPLFAALPRERTALLDRAVGRRFFTRGEVVCRKGDPGDSLFIITDGQVKVVLPSDGSEEVLLGIMEAGDFFGELSLIDGLPRSATIVATAPTETLILQREEFLNCLRTSPDIAIEILQVLSRRLRQTDQFIEDATFLDVAGRLAKKILELAESYGQPTPSGIFIDLRVTQQELANMVGATRESVNKHLRSYRARGIIDIDRQRLRVLKPDELRRRIY